MITFPDNAKTTDDRRSFCYRLVERLRLEHNAQGARVGHDLTLAAFREWKRTDWLPRQKAAFHGLNQVSNPWPMLYPMGDPRQDAIEAELSAFAEAGRAAKKWDDDIDLAGIEPVGAKASPPDPVENFLPPNYVEFDLNGHLSTTATRATWAGMTGTETCHIYKDFGAGFFDGDYEFLFETYNDEASGTSFAIIMELANLIDDEASIRGAGGDSLYAYWQAALNRIWLAKTTAGAAVNLGAVNLAGNTLYYPVIERDEAVGANGTLYLRIYDDALRTNLVTTLSGLLSSKVDFRYFYPINSFNGGQPPAISGYTQNVDLQVQSVVPIAANHYNTRRSD